MSEPVPGSLFKQQDRHRYNHYDLVIVGSGAGGGYAFEKLSRSYKKVLLIEEGDYFTSKNFDMKESKAYSNLYQEGAARRTKDNSIYILQGKSVGGSTTINWTSSFETPNQTLEYWKNEFSVKGVEKSDLKPFFKKAKEDFFIIPWTLANKNNDSLKTGCEKLNYSWGYIPRNVKACQNLGYCGLGCPVNAKQSTLIRSIPIGLEKGGEVVYSTRVEKVEFDDKKNVKSLICKGTGTHETFEIKTKKVILAGGAINTPAILFRSKAPNPYNVLGKRTFLHPVTFSMATMKEEVNPYYGAPQSVYSDEFQWKNGVSGPMGFKIEVPPLLPGFASGLIPLFGNIHLEQMNNLKYTQGLLSLLRDGFHEESKGGQVYIRSDQSPGLDYPLTDYVFDGVKRSYMAMAEIQFASGAQSVLPLHSLAKPYSSWNEAKNEIPNLLYKPHKMRLGSAHVMGGCGMSEDERKGVVNSKGQHHQIENLYVFDGSLFPTSLGVNPQLSIFGLVGKLCSEFKV